MRNIEFLQKCSLSIQNGISPDLLLSIDIQINNILTKINEISSISVHLSKKTLT